MAMALYNMSMGSNDTYMRIKLNNGICIAINCDSEARTICSNIYYIIYTCTAESENDLFYMKLYITWVVFSHSCTYISGTIVHFHSHPNARTSKIK